MFKTACSSVTLQLDNQLGLVCQAQHPPQSLAQQLAAFLWSLATSAVKWVASYKCCAWYWSPLRLENSGTCRQLAEASEPLSVLASKSSHY